MRRSVPFFLSMHCGFHFFFLSIKRDWVIFDSSDMIFHILDRNNYMESIFTRHKAKYIQIQRYKYDQND